MNNLLIQKPYHVGSVQGTGKREGTMHVAGVAVTWKEVKEMDPFMLTVSPSLLCQGPF